MKAPAIQYNNADLKKLIGALKDIVEVVKPEKVICYGGRTHRIESWSSCKGNARGLILTDFDLLFIMPADDRRRWKELRSEIVRFNNSVFRIIPIGHSIDQVNKAIAKGNRFFTSVRERGVVVYERSAIPLAPLPPMDDIKGVMFTFMQKRLSKLLEKARIEKNLMARALEVGDRELAVYHLQLSAAYSCITIIWMYTGYMPETTSLKELLELTEHVSNHAVMIFPDTTEEETYLLDTIASAYNPKHYRDCYNVLVKTIYLLYDRVNDLYEKAQWLGVRKLVSLSSEGDVFYDLDEEVDIDLTKMCGS